MMRKWPSALRTCRSVLAARCFWKDRLSMLQGVARLPLLGRTGAAKPFFSMHWSVAFPAAVTSPGWPALATDTCRRKFDLERDLPIMGPDLFAAKGRVTHAGEEVVQVLEQAGLGSYAASLLHRPFGPLIVTVPAFFFC